MFLVDFFGMNSLVIWNKLSCFPNRVPQGWPSESGQFLPPRDLLLSLLTASSSKVPQKALSAPPVCGAQRKPCQWEIQILKMETEQAADFETWKKTISRFWKFKEESADFENGKKTISRFLKTEKTIGRSWKWEKNKQQILKMENTQTADF